MYKPLSGRLLDDGRVIFASVIEPARLDESVAVTAHLFQQQVPKSHELRVTVVDGRVLTARFDALTAEGRVDWRSDYGNLRYSAGGLPDEVEAKVCAFMQQADGYLSDPHWRQAFAETPRHHLTTQLDDGISPDPSVGPLTGEGTSSSTQPSLMALMLNALRFDGGERVLEIGTGTGRRRHRMTG